MTYDITWDRALRADEFIDLLTRSGLAERRPIDDRACIEGMLANADLTVCAWEGERLIGVARSITDFHYACYLSDLAVDRAWQGRGVGRELQCVTQSRLGPRCKIVLLAAPAAEAYYPRLGYTRHESCWVLRRDEELRR